MSKGEGSTKFPRVVRGKYNSNYDNIGCYTMFSSMTAVHGRTHRESNEMVEEAG